MVIIVIIIIIIIIKDHLMVGLAGPSPILPVLKTPKPTVAPRALRTLLALERDFQYLAWRVIEVSNRVA